MPSRKVSFSLSAAGGHARGLPCCLRSVERKRVNMKLKAVLLDIDGTLVDSNDAHAQAWVDALSEAGYDASFDRVRRLIGKGGDKVVPEMTGLSAESPEGKKIRERRGAIFEQRYLPRLRPFPRARELLERMHRDGLRLVAATSSDEQQMERLLDVTGGAELFHRTTSSDDVPRSKPDPDVVRAALKKARATASEAILLGDTPYDMTAAVAEGVTAVAVRSGGWNDAELTGATAIYDDVTDLLNKYDQSPFAQNRSPARYGRAMLRGAGAGAGGHGGHDRIPRRSAPSRAAWHTSPQEIVRGLRRRAGLRALPGSVDNVLTAAAHLGYGVASGIVFSLLRRRRASRAQSTALGAAFGAALWGASYSGWVPAAGLLPPPHRDRPGRQPVLIAAHLIYGAVLGSLAGPR